MPLSFSKKNNRWSMTFILLVYCLLVSLEFALASPNDPLTGSTPSFDQAPEGGTNYNSGDWGVSEQNGAATYTFPIDVPSGRNGMAPSLSLRYSSNLPLRGGLAVGWGLHIPSIEKDLSLGVTQETHYKIDLGSASGRLVEVTDRSPYPQGLAYRVQFDRSNTRIFSSVSGSSQEDIKEWVALTPDGIRHYFKKSSNALNQGVWHITSQVDSHGNTVRYIWSDIVSANDIYLGQSLASIEYTANNSAGLIPHAKVEFEYDPMKFCFDTDTSNPAVAKAVISDIPIGAAYRKGSKLVTGAQQLTTIKTHIRDTQTSDWRLSKQISLKYLLRNSVLYKNPPRVAPENPLPSHLVQCKQNPLRYLTQVDVKAYDSAGTVTSLPPTKFKYNHRIDTSRTLLQTGIRPRKHLPVKTIDSPGFGQEGISGTTLGGLQKTLLDINNDGIRDRVSVIEENKVCTLVWHKGLLGGAFETEAHKSALPTAAWYREWRGISDNDELIKDKEGCTLNGQIAYRSTLVQHEPRVPDSRLLAKGMLGYYFMDYSGDGRLDLIVTISTSAFDCAWTYMPWADMRDGRCAFDQGVESTTGYTGYRSSGSSTWYVYRGTGNPDKPFTYNFFTSINPSEVNSWLPSLASPTNESKINRDGWQGHSVPMLFDLDGDGFLDIIASKKEGQLGCDSLRLLACDWSIYFGNGHGENYVIPQGDAYIWNVPDVFLYTEPWLLAIEGNDERVQYIKSRSDAVKLLDINGDGLADLVVRKPDGKMYSYRNTGMGFDNEAQPLNEFTVLETVDMDVDQQRSDNISRVGDRGYSRRLIDLDSDGLLDMVWFDGGGRITATTIVKVKFNLGDRFGNEVTLLFPEKWAHSKRLLSAEWPHEFDGTWHLVSDFTDVTGDGLADLVQWQGDTMSYISKPGLPSAPDLLREVTNGRGMKLSFSYASSTDREVVSWTADNNNFVTKDNSALPYVTWVVKKITVKSGHGTPPLSTQYQYQNPIYLSAGEYTNFDERSQFVGFEKNIQTTHYANDTSKQIRKQYKYKGLHSDLINIQTFRDDQLQHVERAEWSHKTLFDDRVQIALPVQTTTCITHANDMSEEDCFAQNNFVHRIEKSWQYNNISRQFLNNQKVEGSGYSAQEGDHRTDYEYDIRYGLATTHDPEDYRIRVRETTETVRSALNNFENLIGHSITDFNTETGLPDKLHTFFDSAISAVTSFSYDALTGNLLKMQKPMQSLSNGGADTFSAFSYDSHQLFIEETSNELKHITKTKHDIATGILIKREGPNSILNSSPAVYDTEKWKIDGFGRVLSHNISIDVQVNGNTNYVEHTVERYSYGDMNFHLSGQPTSNRIEQLLDIGGTHWLPMEQDFDGLGRVLETRQLFNGEMTTHTTYRYNDSGGIASIETPDPSNQDNRITFTYDYDGLGRVTLLKRPDNTSIAVSYEGLSQTITEETFDDTGGSKTKRSDVFGRLIELQEHNFGIPSAVTRYQYDVLGNLEKITDAEENITTMSHDWQGNRMGINRGQRTWQYRYDLNDNLISKQSPMPENSDPNQYTTTYAYDDLDRLLSEDFIDIRLSKAPLSADNTLPPETMSSIHYQYDERLNGIGRLTQVDLPFGAVTYDYDIRGLITEEKRSFTLNEIANMSTSQLVKRTYNALGQLTESNWQGAQKWRIGYDNRGLVDSVDWFDPMNISWKSVAYYERDLTGLPLVRKTDYGQTRNFTYDILSRPLTDNVKLNSSTSTLAERIYVYTGAGNLASVLGHTNSVNADANYGYDFQHRLLTATTSNGYQGSFTYSATGNILSANVSWNNSPETRNVKYSYGQVDPQAVDNLQNITTGDSYADFAYDNVGNMTWRSAPEGDTLLHWDGQDRIRRADTPNGSETYYYDHTGQRMLVVNPDQGVRFWFGEREIHYNLDGTETLNYLHLSAGGPTLARVENSSNIELQYADALQNLMFSLDKDSNVIASFLYGPFGEVVAENGAEVHRRQFNGKENDITTGLRYYGYRYYDPLILRWNSADPLYTVAPDLGLQEPQRMNLYAFSLNNPVRYFDPDGREAKDKDENDDTINDDCISDRDDCIPDDDEAAGCIVDENECIPVNESETLLDTEKNSMEISEVLENARVITVRKKVEKQKSQFKVAIHIRNKDLKKLKKAKSQLVKYKQNLKKLNSGMDIARSGMTVGTACAASLGSGCAFAVVNASASVATSLHKKGKLQDKINQKSQEVQHLKKLTAISTRAAFRSIGQVIRIIGAENSR